MEKSVLKKEVTSILLDKKNNSKDKRALAVFNFLAEHDGEVEIKDVQEVATSLDNSVETTGYAVDYSIGVMSYLFAKGVPVDQVTMDNLQSNYQAALLEKKLAEYEIQKGNEEYASLVERCQAVLTSYAEAGAKNSAELKKINAKNVELQGVVDTLNNNLSSLGQQAENASAAEQAAKRNNQALGTALFITGTLALVFLGTTIFHAVGWHKETKNVKVEKETITETKDLTEEQKTKYEKQIADWQNKYNDAVKDKQKAEDDLKDLQAQYDAYKANHSNTDEDYNDKIAEYENQIAEKALEILDKQQQIDDLKEKLGNQEANNAIEGNSQNGNSNTVTPVADNDDEGRSPSGYTGQLGDEEPGKNNATDNQNNNQGASTVVENGEGEIEVTVNVEPTTEPQDASTAGFGMGR